MNTCDYSINKCCINMCCTKMKFDIKIVYQETISNLQVHTTLSEKYPFII